MSSASVYGKVNGVPGTISSVNIHLRLHAHGVRQKMTCFGMVCVR